MTEILLTCPACGTVYKLPTNVISEQGREVECSSCNNVWIISVSGDNSPPETVAPPQITNTNQEDADVIRHDPRPDRPDRAEVADLSPVRQRLPADVLNILREEVEFEHRARHGQVAPQSLPPLSDDSSDADWPATTVIVPSWKKPVTVTPMPSLSSDQSSDGPVAGDIPASPPDTPADDQAPPAHIAESVSPPIPRISPPDWAAKKNRKGRGGYLAGFGLALSAAAAAAALYKYTPDLADKGQAGKHMMEVRRQVDEGRMWLEQRLSALIDSYKAM